MAFMSCFEDQLTSESLFLVGWLEWSPPPGCIIQIGAVAVGNAFFFLQQESPKPIWYDQ